MKLMKPAISAVAFLLAWPQQNLAAEACLVQTEAKCKASLLKALTHFRSTKARAFCLADRAPLSCRREDRSQNYSPAQPHSSPSTLARMVAIGQ